MISNDGGSLISQDGAGVIAAGSHVMVDGRAFVVSNDGGSLISQDGAGFRINVPLISQDGAGFRNQ